MDTTTIRIYLIAIFAGVLGALGDGLLNYWAKRQTSGITVFILGLLSWNAALLLFTRLLFSASLARAVILFLVANSIAIAFISFSYFREPLSMMQWIGFAIAIFGIILMESSK
ncbi:MAG: hypothetical protein LC768_09370 [Acidobacteria bacterium]|nr:hypothetical protein [Acidobacteriota bacterium]